MCLCVQCASEKNIEIGCFVGSRALKSPPTVVIAFCMTPNLLTSDVHLLFYNLRWPHSLKALFLFYIFSSFQMGGAASTAAIYFCFRGSHMSQEYEVQEWLFFCFLACPPFCPGTSHIPARSIWLLKKKEKRLFHFPLQSCCTIVYSKQVCVFIHCACVGMTLAAKLGLSKGRLFFFFAPSQTVWPQKPD